MTYTVLVEQTERNYAAFVPDLPGCVATAKTMDELKQLIHDAIVMHINGMKEDGLPIPEPSQSIEIAL